MATKGAITAAKLKASSRAEIGGHEDVPAIRVKKTSELVADHIRNIIIRGELKPGDSLHTEAQLIERFHTSRATIREAFRILEAEQFISVTRGRHGATVHLPKAADAARYAGFILQAHGATLSDVYDVRAAIEPYAVWQLAKARRTKDVAILRADLASAAVLQEEGDVEGFYSAIAGFHHRLVDLSGSPSLLLMVSMVQDLIESHQALLVGSAPVRAECHGLKSFWHLVDLIEAGEAEKAQAHWRLHIQTTNETWLGDSGDRRLVDALHR